MTFLPLTPNTIAQGFGLVATVISWVGMASSSDMFLKKTATVFTFLFAIHYYLLGLPVAALVCIVITIRNFASLFKMARRLAPIFICMHISVGIALATDIYTWLPSIATAGGAIAYFYTSGILMRGMLIGCAVLWLIHNIHAMSIGGVISCVVEILITLRTIYRISRRDDLIECVVPVPETIVLPQTKETI